MGFELLTQPQVFTTRLTAIGGIEGYVPPFIAKFHTWTINTPNVGTTFDIPQDFVGLTYAPDDAYIVNIDGSIVPPTDFTIDYNFRKIIFNSSIPQNTTIHLTQIGTIALTANSYVALTALNLFAGITEISADSSTPALYVLQEGSGDGVLVDGRVTINDELSVAGPVTINDELNIDSRLFMSGDITGYSWIGARDPGGTPNESTRIAIGFVSDNTGRITQQVLRTDNKNRFVINEDGFAGIGSDTPETPLHISNGSSKILQTPTGNVSPTIQQNFITPLINTRTGIDIADEANPVINIGSNSHRLNFNRTVPIQIAPYWLSSSPVPTNTFTLVGGGALTTNPQNYVVTVGGLVNPYGGYTVNNSTRALTFQGTVPANVDVFTWQLINPILASGYDVTATTQVTGIVSPSVSTVSLVGLDKPWYTQQYQYLVSFNGITQVADTGSPVYTITPETSTLNFVVPIPGTYLVTVTRLPSANPNSPIFADACFVAESFNWSFIPGSSVNSLTLNGGPDDLLTDSAGYIVNIGGVLQVPTSYRVDPYTRRITFNQVVGAGTNISITQVAHPEFPINYSTTFDVIDVCANVQTGDAEEVVKIRPGELAITGSIATTPPVTVTTTTYSVPLSVSSIIFDIPSACTVTLPPAYKYPGRWLYAKKISSNVVNVSPNILSFISNASTDELFSSAAGRWAHLQSDGTNWIIMAQGNQD